MLSIRINTPIKTEINSLRKLLWAIRKMPAIESAMPVLEELHEIGGFAAITDSEVPDF